MFDFNGRPLFLSGLAMDPGLSRRWHLPLRVEAGKKDDAG
jgi:hypothetical protein